jgi:myo-inositol-1(or 4)-monophosphatase
LYRKEAKASGADSRIFSEVLRTVENKVRRDFGELANLQTSRKSSAFASATLEYLGEKFCRFFREKRPAYSLHLENYPESWTEDGENSIYINSLCGVNNFLHAIPYFATLLALRKNGEVVFGLVNNYSSGETFSVSRGEGAFLNGRRIRVSSRAHGENTLTSVRQDGIGKLSGEIFLKLGSLIVTDCYPLDFCHVACGRHDASVVFDGSMDELELGKLFVTEAGGLHHDFGNGGSVAFGNSSMIDNIRKILV